MSETNSGPPSDAGGGSHRSRGRRRFRGVYRGTNRPMRGYPPRHSSETRSESPAPSALQLETNEQAPSAPASSNAPLDLSLPAKPVEAIECLKNNRPRGPPRHRGPKKDNPPSVDQPSTSTSEKPPQATPAPSITEAAPLPSAPSTSSSAEEPRRGGHRGSRRGRGMGHSGPSRRPDKQPARDSSTVSAPRQPNMESDSSSSCSSSVPTPTHPPTSLAPVDEHSPSSSQTGNASMKNEKKSQFPDDPVGLDTWAESTSNEDLWKTEPTENSWGSHISTAAIHIDPRPTPSAATSNEPSVPPLTVQPAVVEPSAYTPRVDKHPASGSQTGTGPRNNEKEKSQSQEGPASLDTWAESASNEDMWKAESTEDPQGSHIPATSTRPDPQPATRSNEPSGSLPSTQPPADSSRTSTPRVDERPVSGSRTNRGPRNNEKGKRPQAPERPAGLDIWAEGAPNENLWKPVAAESPRPLQLSVTPTRRPTPTGTPSNELAGPAHPIQPPVEESPTSMRRVGLAYVLLGPGASVQAVFTDAESPWVMISALPKYYKKGQLFALLSPFGATRSVKLFEPRRETKYLSGARILFERHEQARYAVDKLNGQLVQGKPIAARLDTDASGGLNSNHIPGLNDDTAGPSTKPQSSLIANDPTAIIKSATVKVTWFAPTSTVYVTYPKAKIATDQVKEMNGRTFMNRRVKMIPMFTERDNREVVRENGGYMVRITGLMGDPEMEKLRRFVRSKDVVVHPNYSSELALRKLREELADVAPLESFRLLPHRRDDLKLHALAQYTTPAAAAAAVKVFENRRGEYLGNSPILVSRHLTVKYSISSKLAEVLQGEINKLHSWAIDDPDLTVRQIEDQHKPGFIQLLLAGNDTKHLVTAKSQLDRALAGVPLSTVDGVKIWDSYFTTEDGASFLEGVAESCKICARADKRTNSILLFGPGYAREEASQQLRAKLVSHSRLRHTVRMQKPVFRRLAAGGITILRDLLGRGNIFVDIFDETLTFYGNDEVARRVQNALDLMYSETGAKLRRRSDCVVCFCRPEKPLLFACGHHYCQGCFSQYVASAAENRTLPLLCIGEDCKASIPLSMITLHANQPDQDALFYAAFQAYVAAHPDQYRYCPTPDCQYIYRVGPEDAVVQCRLCLSNICTHCHIEQHEGITCADYKASHDESEIQKSFDRWRATHNVKPCPNCAAPIEKIAGCNHMMCSACRTHMCWVCLAGFAKGDEVYDHMRKKHGGIGL
ncbi:unnamed protein product [Rhizoctonia solani]|uniref:RBR-type E3 ubiquitin transferase n=1 Tax=Rhizoctonia solani TaxID=456999 RepID=A0A8H2X827_9AGAM|nr:unnamed protein product [Rhizoctonia solani]